MRDLGLHDIAIVVMTGAALAMAGFSALSVLPAVGFERAWLIQKALSRSAGSRDRPLSPGLRKRAARSISASFAWIWCPRGWRSVLWMHRRGGRSRGSPRRLPRGEPAARAIRQWEDHHHSISRSFLDALGHVAHHRLMPHAHLHDKIEPIGDALLRLIEECREPSLQKELRMAHSGLKTGAEQNLEYVSRRLAETARQSHGVFYVELGNAQCSSIRSVKS